MYNYSLMLDFYKRKKILITGHTGFKGSWLTKVLLDAGADIYGYSLDFPTEPCLFDLCKLSHEVESLIGDIRDSEKLNKFVLQVKPDIIFHLAAQPIVRESYNDPVYTYGVNVMGTVNILDAARRCDAVKSIVNVTTDKVYANKEWCWAYRENEEINGFDPYSNSKSCSELVTSCYINSYFSNSEVAISTARAGNVIGGGDFACDRIMPDCLRAIIAHKNILVRNPNSIRPYQHVLEPVMAYLMIAKEQYCSKVLSGCYNVGPAETDCWETGRLVEEFCRQWISTGNEPISWKCVQTNGPHEANYLKLDCSRIRNVFDWAPRWTLATAIQKVVEWDMEFLTRKDLQSCMNRQIEDYIKEN